MIDNHNSSFRLTIRNVNQNMQPPRLHFVVGFRLTIRNVNQVVYAYAILLDNVLD